MPQFSVDSAVTPQRCFRFRAIQSCVPCCHCTCIFTNTFSLYAFILFLDVQYTCICFFFFPSRRTGKEEFVFTKQCVCKIFVEVFLSLCLHLKSLSLPSLLSPLTCPLTSRQFEFKKFQLKQYVMPVLCVCVCACARQSGHLKCITAGSATSVNVVLNGGL